MKLECKACGSMIPAEDVNIEMAIAKCRDCDAVFSFLDQLGDAAPPSQSAGEVLLPAAKPKRFRVEELGKELTISWRWFTPMILFLAFFCLFWDGFLVFWYVMAFRSLFGMGGRGEPFALVMVLFPLLHLAVGVGLTYFTLSSFVNSTVIRARGGELVVSHGPLPWYGNHRLSTSEVRQVYCSENKHRRKHGGVSFSYNVNVLKRDNSKLELVSHLSELDEALFLEEKLRSHLGLSNERVPGSVRG